MAQILLDQKCNPLQMDNKAQTPLINAIQSKNFILVDFFINHAKLELNSDVCHDGKTLLHYFAINCDNDRLTQILINLSVTHQLKKMGQIRDGKGRTPFHYCIRRFDDFCKTRHTEEKQYQSIVNMIRYCLETIECDPDLGIKLTDVSSLEETNIFYLLRTVSFINQTNKHPLELFLNKTKNINVLHHTTRRTALLEAIHLKETKTIDILLHQSSCDINLATSIIPSEGQQTPLILACKLQFLSLVRNLLSHPKCDLLVYDEQHNQALHYYLATSQRSDEYLEIFYLFIEKLKSIDKNSLNNPGKSNRTPLHIAVYHNLGTVDNTNDVEQILIDNRCNLFIQDDLGNLPLHNIFLTKKVEDDPVELCALIMQAMKYDLLDTKNNEGNTPLYLAVIKASTVCIMLLLKHRANLLIENHLSNSKWIWKYAIQSNRKTIERYSLIHLIIQRNWQGALSLILDELDRFHLKHIQVFIAAILNNRFNLVLRLLSTIKNRTILNQKNTDERNLFHIIANIQQHDRQFLEKFFNCLHDKQVEWNIPDKYGSYPLHYACVIQNKPLIEFLQKKYSNQCNFYQTDSFNNTAYGLLFWSTATKKSFDKLFFQTLINSGKSIDCLCNYDNEIPMNPLSFGCINSSSGYVSEYPPVKSKDNVRTSPLINAIVHDHFELAKFLLQLGADVNFPDEEQRTPLMHAVRQNNIDMVKLLLNPDYTITVNNQYKTMVQPRKKHKSKRFFLGGNRSDTDDSDDQSDTENNISKEIKTTDNCKTFPIKSNIDINASDALGRTCIHYLVQPFSDASYTTNIELLELLYQSGASLTKVDRNGLSPLQYSVNNGCQHLYEKLLELIDEKKSNSIQSTIKSFYINDLNTNLLGLPDFYSDAQKLIDQYILKHSSQILPIAFQVDSLSNMSQTGEILIDTEKNEPYDVRLTITDVDYGLIGLYNFYRMQIIKHKSKTNLYLLFTRWGRIGDGDGQHQLTPYSLLDECRAEFCKIFREKTGNLWEKTDQFEKKPKKYTLIQLNERQFQRYINVPIDFQRLQDDNQHPSSKLQSSPYKIFFKTLIHPEAIRVNLAKSQLDVEWMPVSQLKPSILQKARDILVQLKKDIQEKDKLKLTIQQSTCTEQKEKNDSDTQQPIDDIQKSQFKLLLDSICKLTNEYYSIIPLQGYGDERLSMIDNEMAVKAQEQKLDDILELELSYKILLAAQANLNQMSPLDYLYKSINCQFEAMNRNDMDSEFILRYIWTSAAHIKVEQIFKIARPNVDERLFQRNLKNHYLLWHGTNVCNLISILTRGLLIGPLCATTTGTLFGKGIYTADVFAKSLKYCTGVRQDDGERCFMLLCQVALGDSQEVDNYQVDLNEPLDLNKHQSRKAHGSQIPDPPYTITRNYGVQMPLGQLINCKDSKHRYHRCTYNEYIVFDESQIALRYLVQFRR